MVQLVVYLRDMRRFISRQGWGCYWWAANTVVEREWRELVLAELAPWWMRLMGRRRASEYVVYRLGADLSVDAALLRIDRAIKRLGEYL